MFKIVCPIYTVQNTPVHDCEYNFYYNVFLASYHIHDFSFPILKTMNLRTAQIIKKKTIRMSDTTQATKQAKTMLEALTNTLFSILGYRNLQFEGMETIFDEQHFRVLTVRLDHLVHTATVCVHKMVNGQNLKCCLSKIVFAILFCSISGGLHKKFKVLLARNVSHHTHTELKVKLSDFEDEIYNCWVLTRW